MFWFRLGSLMMFLAVGLGAFGAHAMRSKLTEYSLEVYKTAVLYHMIHALGLFVIGYLSGLSNDPKIGWAGILLITGIILFSGSLYVLSATGLKWLGAITPLGGISFLAAWVLIFLSK